MLNLPRRRLRLSLVFALLFTVHASVAQSTGPGAVPLLMVSDIHFDPFHDPGKVQQLATAPVSGWDAILSSASSPNQAQEFKQLQQTCKATGVDTPYELLQSSLKAMQEQGAAAKFILLSGDLIAHQFDCRYSTLFPGKKPDEYVAFIEKTIRYVTGHLHGALPSATLYFALGNNDSGCGDYRLDEQNNFLALTAKILAEGLPASQQKNVLQTFTAYGDYSVTMPAPMQNTRLLVLDNIFQSKNYLSCAGSFNPNAATAQLDWLGDQLAAARQQKQKVWVMAHIPPGVNMYSTLLKRNVCGGDSPEMFYSAQKLSALLAEYADVVKLGVFAHTHMDELRLLPAAGGTSSTGVPIKMVSSISPVNGNNPSFTVAQVDATTSTLRDYRVIASSNPAGTSWSEEYVYSQSFHEPDFSAVSLQKLIGQFQADPAGSTQESQAYMAHFFVGGPAGLLRPIWTGYTCVLSHYQPADFVSCMCPATAPQGNLH